MYWTLFHPAASHGFGCPFTGKFATPNKLFVEGVSQTLSLSTAHPPAVTVGQAVVLPVSKGWSNPKECPNSWGKVVGELALITTDAFIKVSKEASGLVGKLA